MPTQQQLIAHVNNNSGRVRQLQTEVRVKAAGFPALKGNLALDRPRRFRLRAGVFGLQDLGFDMGSNDQEFWLWTKSAAGLNQHPGLFFARHDQLANPQVQRAFPVDPSWLIDALGLVTFNPMGRHEGPTPRGVDQLEIRSYVPSPTGDLTKVTLVHAQYGWVLQQQIYNQRGQLLASARASQHRYYAHAGVSLPQHVDVQLAPGQPSELSFELDMSDYYINQIYGDPEHLWSMPRPQGVPIINLADPSVANERRRPAGPLRENLQSRRAERMIGRRPVYRGIQR